MFFAAQTAIQLLVQFGSLLLGTVLFSGYAVQLCDLDLEEITPPEFCQERSDAGQNAEVAEKGPDAHEAPREEAATKELVVAVNVVPSLVKRPLVPAPPGDPSEYQSPEAMEAMEHVQSI